MDHPLSTVPKGAIDPSVPAIPGHNKISSGFSHGNDASAIGEQDPADAAVAETRGDRRGNDAIAAKGSIWLTRSR